MSCSRSSSAASASTSRPRSRGSPIVRQSAEPCPSRGGTRSRPAAAASSGTSTCGSSPEARGGFRVRRRDRGRVRPAKLHSRGGEGDHRGDARGRPGGLPGRRRAGRAVRRLLPLGGLVRNGLQDRRLHGVQGGGEGGGPGPPRADRGGRGAGPEGIRGSRDGRLVIQTWKDPGHGLRGDGTT